MRGTNREQSGMFSYILAERRVPKDHPLQPVRAMVDAPLRELSGRGFRLAQDRGGAAQDAPSRCGSGRLDVHLGRCGLRPGADPQPDGYLNRLA